MSNWNRSNENWNDNERRGGGRDVWKRDNDERKNERSDWNSDSRRSNDGYRDRGNREERSWGDKDRRGGWGGDRKRRGGSGSGMDVPLPPAPEEAPSFEKVIITVEKKDPRKVEEFRRKNEMTVKGTEIPDPIFEFEELKNPEFIKVFKMKEYAQPTPIQCQGWSMALSGRDMVGIAQTGSGKTISFAIPSLIHVSKQIPLRRGDGPIVLVLAPTRELCLQIEEEFAIYAPIYNCRTLSVYGGVSSFPQKSKLSRGVEVLVATPGRLIDLLEQGYTNLKRVSFLVLDEADRMLDMGFEPQLRKIIPITNPKRQTLMWSATWPREVQTLARNYLNDYISVVVGSHELNVNEKINQKFIVADNKLKELTKIIDDNFRNHVYKKIIIFCNMKRTCDNLEDSLRSYNVNAIHGDKSQNIRDRIIGDFKSGRTKILIATDVAARGLDVKDISLVINYDFPMNIEDYVHRVGRTARGTESGESVSLLVFGDNVKDLIKLLESSDIPISSDLRNLARTVPRSRGIRRW